MSRVVLDIRSALWAWPLTLLLVGLWAVILRGTALGEDIRDAHPIWYSCLLGGIGGTLGAMGIRRGFRLVLLRSNEEK